jgi:hypothetical protein
MIEAPTTQRLRPGIEQVSPSHSESSGIPRTMLSRSIGLSPEMLLAIASTSGYPLDVV